MGVLAIYNIRVNRNVYVGKVAVRKIFCTCESRIIKLKRQWIPRLEDKEQLRFKKKQVYYYDRFRFKFVFLFNVITSIS